MSRQKSPTRSRTGWRAWRSELVALLGSVLSFTAMVVLLAVFNGRPIFEWKRVTLNAIVSTLSVSMKASFTFAIAELIGQWKWITFARDAHQLFEFERINMASRGPLGGIRVLFKKHSSWPLRLGSALIVLAIALDPFSQQLLQLQPGTLFVGPGIQDTPYTTRATGIQAGHISHVNETKSRKPGETVITVGTNLDIPMQAAVLDGVSRSEHVVKQQSHVECATGICTWPSFQTLGVCHRCTDLSPQLKKHDHFGKVYYGLAYGDTDNVTWDDVKDSGKNTAAIVLPNGHFLVEQDRGLLENLVSPISYNLMSSFGTGNPNKTNSMQDIDTLIWSMSVIHSTNDGPLYDTPEERWPDVDLSAQECALYYCVKEIKLSVDGNIIQENATEVPDAKRDPASWASDVPGPGAYAPENIPPDNELGSLEFDKFYSHYSRNELVLHFPDDPSKPSYSIFPQTVWSLNHFIEQLLSTNITGGANMTALISEVLPDNSAGYNGIIDCYGSEPLSLEGIWTSNLDVPATFSALATSITNEIRRTAEDEGYGGVVYGRKGTPTQYYQTEWGWIVLHGMMLIGGALFFYVTVWNQPSSLGDIPTWKNSSLAVLSQGPIAEAVLKETELVPEMERRAREETVKMARDHGSTNFRMRK